MAAVVDNQGTPLRALYDYDPQREDELPLFKGVLYTGIKIEDGFWTGYRVDEPNNIKIFPSNYVEFVVSKASPDQKDAKNTTNQFRAERLNKMKRQSIFAPDPEDKVNNPLNFNNPNLENKSSDGTRKRSHKVGKSGGVSIDGPVDQTVVEAQRASEEAKKKQKLSRKSQQSHTLRYSVFAHNLASVSAIFLLFFSPIAMIWGTECLSRSLVEGELGVLSVNGEPRVRINSESARKAAIAAGVDVKHMIDTPSACNGETDYWIGVIGCFCSIFILLIFEPLCGNRRDTSGKFPNCILSSKPGAGNQTLNFTFPWRGLSYLIMGCACVGSVPTVVPGCGLLVVSIAHCVAAIKGEHGNANPPPSRGKKKRNATVGEKITRPCGGYYYPTILRCGLCGTAKGLWDGRSQNYYNDDKDSNCWDPIISWWHMECTEKSNIGKWFILTAYFAVNLILFSQRFDVMVNSGALVSDEVLYNISNPTYSELSACDNEHTPTAGEWPTFSCPSTGETPAPQENIRAFCEAQLSEQAEDKFESIHIGALRGFNVQPNQVRSGNAMGMAWIVVHSPTSITFRIEASQLTGPPVAVHLHGPANALGAQIGSQAISGQGATGPVLMGIYQTPEYGTTSNPLGFSIELDKLGEKSKLCPVVGKSGEELRCESARIKVSTDFTTYLRRGRVYLNVHTQKFPEGEIRANLRETFISILDSPLRDSESDAKEDEKGKAPSDLVQQYQGQGVATVYLLDDGVDLLKRPSVDFSILIGNLVPGPGGFPSSMNIVREELSKIEGTTDSSATGTNLQILCDDSLTTVRSCSVGANAGCLGNKPPNNLPEGTNVLAGGGTAAKTIDIGICGPFTPPPLRTARTPTGARTNVGGGAVFEFGTDGNKNIANETVRAMRTRRAAFHITNDLQDKLVQGTLQSAVAIAYALPPLATKPARLAGDFVTFPATKNQPTTAAGIASVRLINPRSFAYVLELYEMSGVPTNGIFIRGPGLRRNSRTPQLTIHTVASVMVGNGTAAIRAATQECELVSASLTVCAGTVDNIDEAMISALLKGKLYIDVRTSMYPFGELRAVLNTRDGLFISGSSIIAGNNGFGTSTNGNDNGETGTRTCTQPLARNLGLSYGGAWAKAFGQMLNFNCALVLYPILRYLLRKINNFGSNDSQGGISSWIPLHRNIDFHKLIAAVIGLCTIGHVVAHYLNYGKSPDATIVRFSWLAWLTGALITFSMLLIFSGGQANVKRAHYELFLNTHRAFIVFMICLLLHGPSYYIWGLVGIILYILEIVMRQYRGSHHYFVRSVKYVHPVMQIKFRPRHPDEFTFKEGQYLYLNCPYVSKNEWHPFTISSAVGDLDQGGEQGWISVHIRIIPGGWTENTLRYFCAMDGRDLNQDDLKNDLFLSLSSRDAKGQIQIGKDRGIDGKPLLLVDGPHAAPAQHYSMFDHVMMIGAGIGLTPSCSILRSVLKYKWKKGWKPPLLRFYWVVRHSEIDSFLWFLEQLIQFEKEIVADRAAGTIRNIHIFEANIYITRAPKPNECTQNPKKIPDHVLDLLLAFKTNIRSESESRGLAANPRSHTNHMRVDVGPARNLSSGNSFVNRGGVAEAGLSQAVDIGYDIERLYESMYNPCVPSKNQTTAQLRENAEMADNRLGSIWLWNGRPDWNQIFDQNKITPYVTTGIGVAFCGTPFIGKDLSKYCRIKSNPETGQVFHLLKENF